MAFQTAMLASEAFVSIRGAVPNWKAQAQNAQAFMAGNSVNSNYIFSMLDQLASIINALNTYKAIAGLDAYATSMGYPNSMVSDCTATANAATACIQWITANFPSSGGFLQAETLNADGSRTARSFTSGQTAGLQTALGALVATIS